MSLLPHEGSRVFFAEVDTNWKTCRNVQESHCGLESCHQIQEDDQSNDECPCIGLVDQFLRPLQQKQLDT